MYTLKKNFRFESAHLLGDGYKGKCNNIHGHSWNGEISMISGDLNEFAMGIDYADIKRIYKPFIEILDHALFVNRNSDEALINYCMSQGHKIIIFEVNPTSEIIAQMLWFEFVKLMPSRAALDYIKINETCTSECIYKFSDGDRAIDFEIKNQNQI
jgi:6-pyruvoyltetrahydropterin/6-carboxytetrahydropterin synthase